MGGHSSQQLSKFSAMQEIAFDSTRKQSIFVADSNGAKALIFVEPKSILKCELEKALDGSTASSLTLLHTNDRWFSYSNSMMKIDITFQATEREISTISSKTFERFVTETPQLYASKIRPFMDSSPEHQPPLWIKNILNGTSEQDRIIFQNEDTIILPDSKWSGENLESIYLLVLFRDESLRTIRDLATEAHLCLLKKLRAVLEVVTIIPYTFDRKF